MIFLPNILTIIPRKSLNPYGRFFIILAQCATKQILRKQTVYTLIQFAFQHGDKKETEILNPNWHPFWFVHLFVFRRTNSNPNHSAFEFPANYDNEWVNLQGKNFSWQKLNKKLAKSQPKITRLRLAHDRLEFHLMDRN